MADAGPLSVVRTLWHRARDRVLAYLANDDPLAAAANAGAFIVWSNQPFYPIYVWALVGHDAWPSLLTWFSTPFFFAVPLVARSRSIRGRGLFVATGVLNTLLSTKAFGLQTGVAWFLVPCLILVLGFFRRREWKIALALFAVVVGAALACSHLGAPLHFYEASQAAALLRLNVWAVSVLSLYLVYAAVRAHRQTRA